MSKHSQEMINNPSAWLSHIKTLRGESSFAMLESAFNLYKEKASPLLKKGVSIADILLSLGLDNETLAVALIYPLLQEQQLPVEMIAETFGESANKLLHDALQMRSFSEL